MYENFYLPNFNIISMHFLAPENAAWWIGKHPHLFDLHGWAPLFNWKKRKEKKKSQLIQAKTQITRINKN